MLPIRLYKRIASNFSSKLCLNCLDIMLLFMSNFWGAHQLRPSAHSHQPHTSISRRFPCASLAAGRKSTESEYENSGNQKIFIPLHFRIPGLTGNDDPPPEATTARDSTEGHKRHQPLAEAASPHQRTAGGRYFCSKSSHTQSLRVAKVLRPGGAGFGAEPRYSTEIWCNGSTTDFGSVCSGSNPDISTKNQIEHHSGTSESHDKHRRELIRAPAVVVFSL